MATDAAAFVGRQQAIGAELAAEREAKEAEMKVQWYRVDRDFDHVGFHKAGSKIRLEPDFGAKLVAAGFVTPIGKPETVEEAAPAPVVGVRPPGAVTPEDKLPAPTSPEAELRKQWPPANIKSTPAAYLRRAPDGDHVDLARKLVAAGLGKYKG